MSDGGANDGDAAKKSESRLPLGVEDGAAAAAQARDLPPGPKSLYLLLLNILVSGVHWGFVSFSAATLNEVVGVSITGIAAFVPTFGAVYLVTTALVGLVADKWPQKPMLLAGILFNAGGQLLFITGEYPLMLAGFAMIGIGYAPWTIVPYTQIKLHAGRNEALYDKWYLAVEVAFVLSFSLGRLLMMACVSFIDNDDVRWRLPWIITAALQGLYFCLILLFARYARPLPRQRGERGHLTYVQKLRRLYLNPLAAVLLAGSAFNGFTTYALAAWAPTIALHRFEGEEGRTEAEINVSISIAVFVAWPLGMLLTVYALRVSNRIKSAMRVSFAHVLVAAGAITVYAAFTHSFYLHIGGFVLFAAAGNFPAVFFKQLPLLLGFDVQTAVFALSRFTLVYSISGDIAGWLVTGIVIDEAGFDAAVWMLVGGAWAAALCWGVLVAWSFKDSGPVHERSVAELRTDRALHHWSSLRSMTLRRVKTSRAISAAIGASNAGEILSWLVWSDDGAAFAHTADEEAEEASASSRADAASTA